jgi:hypothetical protein
MSYSQIKSELGVSKSTLSLWLRDLPLSDKRLRELRDFNQVRIEKTRATKQRKRESRLKNVFDLVSKDIGKITKRDLLVAGFFLYWAEGGKTQTHAVILSNTDPAMIRAFISWIQLIGGEINKMYFRLHLYSDMNEEDEIRYWSTELKVPKQAFKKSYIKKSKLSELTYVTRGHGTCNANFPGRDISEYVFQGLARITSLY